MKGGRQRRALAAGGHVAPAEIRHRGDSGAFGYHVGVTELHGDRWLIAGAVINGLAVAADCRDFPRRYLGAHQQLGDGVRKQRAELDVQLPHLRSPGEPLSRDRLQARAQGIR